MTPLKLVWCRCVCGLAGVFASETAATDVEVTVTEGSYSGRILDAASCHVDFPVPLGFSSFSRYAEL